MVNQIVLTGYLDEEPILKELDGKKVVYITIKTTRCFKNKNGDYDVDYFNCILWSGITDTTKEYCHKGDMIGIKGRLQSRLYEKDNEKHYITEVVAERVSFIGKNKNEEIK